MTRYDELRDIDLRRLWHPYTPIAAMAETDFPIIDRAEGVYLYDVRGRALLDGISSWWCVNLGHSHPRLVEAIRAQAERLQHSILGGMSHVNAIRLADRLTAAAPDGLTRAYFASDGSCAVEAAMRMVLQRWAILGEPQRTRFVALTDGYHGDTLAAAGLGYVEAFHGRLKHVLNRAIQADSPHCFHCPCGKTPETCDIQCFASMDRAVRDNIDSVAAVVVEPLCQGAAGMRIYPAEYLRRLRGLCDELQIPLIADEIAVGFGRTGEMFACQAAGVSPDLMCVGKALTGGCLPLSAVLATEEIYQSFGDSDGHDNTFYHGHTFCGNPIAAAAALAALETYEQDDILTKSKPTARLLGEGLERLADLPGVANANAMGMMSALEVTGGAEYAKRTAAAALDLRLFIRPLGDVLYLWPPLVTTPEEMARMLDLLAQALQQAAKS